MSKHRKKEVASHLQQIPFIVNPGKSTFEKSTRWIIACILLVTIVVYWPSLHNGFVWDDEFYILKNPLLANFNLRDIFTKPIAGNYHPLTILILAIEFKMFGLNEMAYHVVNLVLHLMNTMLVYYFILVLSKKKEVAFVAMLLFGVHPLHVESVAWVSEIKDLLYTLFFMLALICYVKFINELNRKYLFLTGVFFICSLLSKAMAASLPLVLVLIDYYVGKKLNLKSLMEKLPFFVFSLFFGGLAIYIQSSFGATQSIYFPIWQRLIFAMQGFVTYLLKLLLPINLSAFYPYPISNGEAMPAFNYLYVIIFLGMIGLVICARKFSTKLLFGMGFYMITLFLVLQILPVGTAMMADRYSYIPSIGIFFLAGELVSFFMFKNNKSLAVLAFSCFALFLCIQTYARCDVWKNEMVFWNDIINQYQTIPVAYNNRGIAFKNEKNYSAALSDFEKSISLNAAYSEAYNNLGVLYTEQQNNEKALQNFNQAIQHKKDYVDAYINRGDVLEQLGKYDEALRDYNKVIELNPDYPGAYYNRGGLFMNQKKYNEAEADFKKAITLNPSVVEGYYNLGSLYMETGKNEEALHNFNQAITINPQCFEAYFNKASTLFAMQRFDEAISNYSSAITIQPQSADAYINKALAENSAGKKREACADLQKAATLGYAVSDEMTQQLCQ